MKYIVFQTPGYTQRQEPDTGLPGREETMVTVEMAYSEENLAIAAATAVDGYTIREDEEDQPPSTETRLAELEEAMDLLLSGVTE